MTVRHTMLIRPACIAAALAAIVVSVVLSLPKDAMAQSDETFRPLFNREAGPFNVEMSWVPPSPQVGIINIGVRPKLLSDGSPVTDARITLVAESEPEHPEFEVVAVNTPNHPEVYRANLKFEEAGNWIVHVKVDSPTMGKADFRSPLVILPAPIEPGTGGAWVFLGIFLVLTAGSLWIVMAIRRSQAARRTHLEGRL